ncbi:putative D-xylose utilization operon transcriptional repressor [Microbacterium lemovicicum]|uniref:Putative D-xylose utilization operon transcriptional repressor n=1 Tax=Microbacterium lemovicicum TaxID=1072463 RepID=A0A3Q9J3H1_9MICO|nr:GntR family transcriptional regulator [Microbacterium lemovicicum]AZS37597.1 putative D-xylose utilization operon transcriptional repressor [Microbacterium lemovicicum]
MPPSAPDRHDRAAAATRAAAAATRRAAATAAARLADELRSRILAGEIPPGTPLREEELAGRHGVSRHTVRTALAALTAERIARAVAFAGTRVATLDDDELVALQQLRAALETEAVRLITAEHGAPWPATVVEEAEAALDRLAAAESAGDWITTTRAHAAVHRAIVNAAGSARIADAYAALESEILLLLAHVRPHYAAPGLADEHRRYLRLLPIDGGEAVRAHLEHSTQLIRAARSGESSDDRPEPLPVPHRGGR